MHICRFASFDLKGCGSLSLGAGILAPSPLASAPSLPSFSTSSTSLKSGVGVQKGDEEDKIVIVLDEEDVPPVQPAPVSPQAQHDTIGMNNIGLRGTAGGLIGTGEGARSGKLEQSILNFKLTYPQWQPEGEHKKEIVNFLECMDGILCPIPNSSDNSGGVGNKGAMGASMFRSSIWGSGGWGAVSGGNGGAPEEMGRSILVASGDNTAEPLGDDEKEAVTKTFFAWKKQALSGY